MGNATQDRGLVNGPSGFYRCETCGERHGMDGWMWRSGGHPAMVCCGVPMRWWTSKQVARGEVPA